MRNPHKIYLISDSTGETLDRIFLALKAQFENFEYEVNQFSFTRTENQIQKILEKTDNNSIILYTIVKFTKINCPRSVFPIFVASGC